VRVAVVVLGVQSHEFEQILYRRADAAGGIDVLNAEWGTDDGADGVPRIQRRVWVLEDHLDVSAQRAHLGGWEVRDVAAVEDDRPGIRLQQPGEQPPSGGLAAARLSHQR
jgi:hypothetical protein